MNLTYLNVKQLDTNYHLIQNRVSESFLNTDVSTNGESNFTFKFFGERH